MEYLLLNIAPSIGKGMILLGGGIVALYALMMRFVTKVKGTFKPYQKKSLLYLFFSVLFFALIGLIGRSSIFNSAEELYIFCQVIFLAAGTTHLYMMRYYINWLPAKNPFLLELIFTTIVGLLGLLSFALTYSYRNWNDLVFLMGSSTITFIIPFFFYNSFERAIAIPPKVRKQWQYPVHEEIEEPDERKLKDMLIIDFEFQKKGEDNHYTNFRAKAPNDMEFGRLFYYFINDYNDRHPNSRIEFLSETGEPQGWVFYKKRNWNTITTHYIDTDKTIYSNRIRENDVIICNRSFN